MLVNSVLQFAQHSIRLWLTGCAFVSLCVKVKMQLRLL